MFRSQPLITVTRSRRATIASGGFLLLLVVSHPALAATFTVTNLDDSGAGSLRAAVDAANANGGADTIEFQAGLTGTITLSTGAFESTGTLAIQGPGSGEVTIDGNNAMMIFILAPIGGGEATTISGLTLTNALGLDLGGAIVSVGNNLTLDDVHITNSIAGGPGGAVYFSGGILTVVNSTFNGNLAESAPFDEGACSSFEDLGGGAIYGEDVGRVTITGSTFSGNGTRHDGGGLALVMQSAPSRIDIDDSVFTGNTAGLSPGCYPASGGAIYIKGMTNDDSLEIENTTVSGNSAGSGRAGGLLLTDLGSVALRRTTVSGNDATSGDGGGLLLNNNGTNFFENVTIANNSTTARGGGVLVSGALTGSTVIRSSTIAGNDSTISGVHAIDGTVVTLRNSIVADSRNSALSASIDDLANDGVSSFSVAFSNIEQPGSSTITSGGGNINVDPALGSLQDNGGPTETLMPAEGSAVIDTGDPAFTAPPSTDQRFFPRVVGSAVDMGAVEYAPPLGAGVVSLSSATYSGAEDGGDITVVVTRLDGSTEAVTVDYATSDGSATVTEDYTPASGTLSWAIGDIIPKTFTIAVTDDAIYEGNETLTVTLSNVTGGASLDIDTAVVTILEDEQMPSLGIGDVAILEGHSGTQSFGFLVTLTQASASVVSVDFATATGSAGAGDFVANSGTLSFAAGVTSQTVNITVIGDEIGEFNETFSVNLSAPENAGIWDGIGIGTIQNDDPPATILGFSATATPANYIAINWSASPGTSFYSVERQTSAAAGFVSLGTVPGNSHLDTSVLPATSYRYRVRAVNGFGVSAYTPPDLATTVIFTDPVLTGATVKAAHLAELRSAVNAVRAFSGLGAASFTGAAVAGAPIQAIHINVLRTALDAAGPAAGLPSGGFTDTVVPGLTIKAVHIDQLRSRVK